MEAETPARSPSAYRASLLGSQGANASWGSAAFRDPPTAPEQKTWVTGTPCALSPTRDLSQIRWSKHPSDHSDPNLTALGASWFPRPRARTMGPGCPWDTRPSAGSPELRLHRQPPLSAPQRGLRQIDGGGRVEGHTPSAHKTKHPATEAQGPQGQHGRLQMTEGLALAQLTPTGRSPDSPAMRRRAGRSPGPTCPPSAEQSPSTSSRSQTEPASGAW